MFYVCWMLDELGVPKESCLWPVWDQSAPDFYLDIQGTQVGLEVTEAYPKDDDGNPLYFQQLRYDSVDLARQRFAHRGPPPLKVLFHFTEGPPTFGQLSKKDVPRLADRLLHLLDVSGFNPNGGRQRFAGSREIPDILSYSITPCEPPFEFWGIGGSAQGLA